MLLIAALLYLTFISGLCLLSLTGVIYREHD